MIHARQHIPGAVSGVEPACADVETAEELLALEWVAQWTEPLGGDAFYRFSFSVVSSDAAALLLVEYDEGRRWWVVAHLTGDAPSGLPVWNPPEEDG